MNYTRRALAFLAGMAAAQTESSAQQAGTLPSRAFPFSSMKGRQSGALKSYPILNGNTHTGLHVDLHESELPAGAAPHPPHRHEHEEMLLVREGEVEVTINGEATRLGPGSCAYIASHDLHGYRNPGNVTAKYFVLALGNG